jgi:hypothetical protein
MSKYQTITTQFKQKKNNPTNFNEHRSIRERIILHFILINKHRNTNT